jgi:hypothetical protein
MRQADHLVLERVGFLDGRAEDLHGPVAKRRRPWKLFPTGTGVIASRASSAESAIRSNNRPFSP